ncbi:MAG: YhgN family NAAT transporter [Chlamydiales bacterium]
MENIFSIAIAFFFLANPIGNTPAIISLLKDIDFQRQKKIMFRESIFALLIAFFFIFCGNAFLSLIQVKEYTLGITGGVLLFLVSIEMIFPKYHTQISYETKKEPFIVPIATPLISGPALMTIVMLKAHTESFLKLSLAVTIAWIGVTSILSAAPYLQKILGKRGLATIEQLMGMLLGMMGVNSIINGIQKFIEMSS